MANRKPSRRSSRRYFCEAEERKHEKPEEKMETFTCLSDRIIYEIEHSFFYSQLEGKMEEIEKNLKKLKEILEYEED